MNYNIILNKLKSKHIVIKHLLMELKNNYPNERGFTQNGFKYSIDNGTLKIKTLEILSKHIGVPMGYWFMGNEQNIKMESEGTIYDNDNTTIINDLRKDKVNMQMQIDMLIEKLWLYEQKKEKLA